MNSNFIFKKLDSTDKSQVFNLIDTVLENLERKEFFIHYSEEEKKQLFDASYGAYDNNKLVAINQLFFANEIVGEYYDILDIEKSASICELGGFLVLKEYEGKGIMTKLSEMQYKLAYELNFDYIIATAHPDNTASSVILQKTGLELFNTITTSSGYLRSLYWKKLRREI